MTKVAIVTPYAPPVPGGISSFVRGLSTAARAENLDVVTFAGAGAGDADSWSDLGSGRSFVERAATALERVSPDIVHCQAHWYTLAAGDLYRQRHPDARLVFSFHTTPLPRRKGRFSRLLRRADVVTFVSLNQRKELTHTLGLEGDLRLFRPATDLTSVDPADAKAWAVAHGLEKAFPVVMFLGPLEYRRKVQGVVDLVRSMPRVLGLYPSTKLVVVGDGTRKSTVVRASKGLAGTVIITGFLANPRPALACADLYSHISYQEGLPLAVLEAMSMGRCVVASPVGGIPEVIDGTNGLLVDGGRVGIAEAVCRLAADPVARERLGAAARETIRKSFTWEARSAELRSLYGVA